MKFVQLADYVDYVMNVDPIQAKQANGADITSDLVPSFQYPDNAENIRKAFESAMGDTQLVENATDFKDVTDARKPYFLVVPGVMQVDIGIAFSMMSGWMNPSTGTPWDTYRVQVGVGSGGMFVSQEEPSNINWNLFTWLAAAYDGDGSSSYTFPRPNSAEQAKARYAVIGGILKAQGWVK
jgi:hypothetical protein